MDVDPPVKKEPKEPKVDGGKARFEVKKVIFYFCRLIYINRVTVERCIFVGMGSVSLALSRFVANLGCVSVNRYRRRELCHL